MLRRAVQCFRNQRYPNRELVIVYDQDDETTARYAGELTDDNIRPAPAPTDPPLTLGGLRNHSIEIARGDYVCNWDDDDWHHPDRLARQMEAIESSGRPACVLANWIAYDAETRRAYITHTRAWEGSLLCAKDEMERYADLARGEDAPPIRAMVAAGKIVGIKQAFLYVYIYHGGNTWHRAHWDKIVSQSTPLDETQTEVIIRTVEQGME